MENKFQFIASGMAQRRKAWDERCDKIIAGMAALDPVADRTFKGHEDKLNEAEIGFKVMQDSIRDLAGGNGPTSEGSAGLPPPSPEPTV